MLIVSQDLMTSLERNMERLRKDRFVEWIVSLNHVIGSFSREKAGQAFDGFFNEATQAGIDTDERLFDYVAARLLMPDMNGLQYIQALDVIFSDQIADRRLDALLGIRSGPNG